MKGVTSIIQFNSCMNHACTLAHAKMTIRKMMKDENEI